MTMQNLAKAILLLPLTASLFGCFFTYEEVGVDVDDAPPIEDVPSTCVPAVQEYGFLGELPPEGELEVVTFRHESVVLTAGDESRYEFHHGGLDPQWDAAVVPSFTVQNDRGVERQRLDFGSVQFEVLRGNDASLPNEFDVMGLELLTDAVVCDGGPDGSDSHQIMAMDSAGVMTPVQAWQTIAVDDVQIRLGGAVTYRGEGGMLFSGAFSAILMREARGI